MTPAAPPRRFPAHPARLRLGKGRADGRGPGRGDVGGWSILSVTKEDTILHMETHKYLDLFGFDPERGGPSTPPHPRQTSQWTPLEWVVGRGEGSRPVLSSDLPSLQL